MVSFKIFGYIPRTIPGLLTILLQQMALAVPIFGQVSTLPPAGFPVSVRSENLTDEPRSSSDLFGFDFGVGSILDPFSDPSSVGNKPAKWKNR